jgi:hypothetical protein
MTRPQETYLQLAIREFKRMKAPADGAVAQITPGQFFAVLSDEDKSTAVIVTHLRAFWFGFPSRALYWLVHHAIAWAIQVWN